MCKYVFRNIIKDQFPENPIQSTLSFQVYCRLFHMAFFFHLSLQMAILQNGASTYPCPIIISHTFPNCIFLNLNVMFVKPGLIWDFPPWYYVVAFMVLKLTVSVQLLRVLGLVCCRQRCQERERERPPHTQWWGASGSVTPTPHPHPHMQTHWPGPTDFDSS